MIDSSQVPSQMPPQQRLPETRPPRRADIRRRKEGIKSVLSTIAILLIAPVIAIFLTVFVFQSYQVDGESMESTLSHNDRLIVWKLPKTWARLTGGEYIPNRGDVVVFIEPNLGDFGQDPGKQLIKRVVALPGERVMVKDGVLTVYNKEQPDGFEPDKTLPYGDIIQETPIDGTWDVEENQVFVVGDNRGNSLDSRTFNPIDTENIVGKLVLRLLPIGEMKKF